MPRAPKPGGVAFEPRSFTDNPKKFGQTSQRLNVEPTSSPQHAAAEFQHSLCNTIREYLLDKGMSLRSFSDNTALPSGLTYERFYRIANGSAMMSLTDLMFWASIDPRIADAVARAIPPEFLSET